MAFEQAYRVRHDAAFLFNIGQCQRQLRRYEEAERSYRAYLRESDLAPTTREQVQKLVAEMQKAVDDQRARLPPPGTQPPAAPRAAGTSDNIQDARAHIQGRVPIRVEKKESAFFRLVNDQRAVLPDGHRRNAPWENVPGSWSRCVTRSLSRSAC